MINLNELNQPIKTFWIAYSGGLDSSVLLYSMHCLRESNDTIQLQAVHINHQLHPDAGKWAEHCQCICDELKIPLEIITVDVVHNQGESLEANARQVRYQVFSELLNENDCLLTAHHQDDQMETFLLQALRGAGPQGLAAMPVLKVLANGFHWRPLLNYSRAEMFDYAEKNHCRWIDDPSNEQQKFDRNFLRHEIIPLLKQRWPSVAKTIARSARHCAEAVDVLGEAARYDSSEEKGMSLSISQLLSLSPPRQKNCIRHWLQQLNFPLPSTIKLEQILAEVLSARVDANPCVHWEDVEVHRYRDQLYAVKKFALETPFTLEKLSWNLQQPLVLPGGLGVLMAEQTPEGSIVLPANDELTVSFRQGGETIVLAGRKHHHSLKKCFQDWGVPPWLRQRLPLLFYRQNLVCVPGLVVADSSQFPSEGYYWDIHWHYEK